MISSKRVLWEGERRGGGAMSCPFSAPTCLCVRPSVCPSVRPSVRPSVPEAAVTQPAVTHRRGGDRGPSRGRPGGESAAPGAAAGQSRAQAARGGGFALALSLPGINSSSGTAGPKPGFPSPRRPAAAAWTPRTALAPPVAPAPAGTTANVKTANARRAKKAAAPAAPRDVPSARRAASAKGPPPPSAAAASRGRRAAPLRRADPGGSRRKLTLLSVFFIRAFGYLQCLARVACAELPK